jgi:hypothetical protein
VKRSLFGNNSVVTNDLGYQVGGIVTGMGMSSREITNRRLSREMIGKVIINITGTKVMVGLHQ